jgi:lipoprotein-anchoring transpeptidase ErfK/SrfK
MVTSAHSNTITDWEGTGDAMVAIHGPLGADRIIGTTGAQVSHGCIRMHRSDQVKLMVVQIGTPISIIG